MMAVKSRTVLVLAALSLLGVALIVAGIAAAQSELHSVTLDTDQNFDWVVTGYIEFRNVYRWGSSTISTAAGSITVNNGDKVRIVVNAVNSGYIWIGTNGWVDIRNLPVDAIYVNDELKASNTVITSTTNLQCDVSSVNSTLRIYATLKQDVSYGWASLTVDGNQLISAWNYDGYIIVYGATVTTSRSLNLNIGGTYFDGVASGVEFVDSSGNVQVIGVPEVGIQGLAVAAPLVAGLALYSRRYSWLKG